MDKTLFVTFVAAFLVRDVVMEIYFAVRDELAARKRIRIMDKFMKEFEKASDKDRKVAKKKAIADVGYKTGKTSHEKSLNKKGFQSK